MNHKVAIILLTYGRIDLLPLTLSMLDKQTYKDFDLYISNGNYEQEDIVKDYALQFKDLNVTVLETSNKFISFRRFFNAYRLRQKHSYDVFLFLDDDIVFENSYVEKALNQYEPKTYKSWWAWSLDGASDKPYRDRSRVMNVNESKVDYCGPGVSIVDASILDNIGLFKPLGNIYHIDDVWMSYFVSCKMPGWKLGFLDVPANFNMERADDHNALWKKTIIGQDGLMTKEEYVSRLIKSGWKL